MGYAFISYSSKDQPSADSMRALLKKNSINSWMAPYDIPIGSKYAMVINRAVKDCSCFILLLTDSAQNSVWVAKEVERAINYRKPIIPIQLEDMVLNDEFELYISSDQIVALPKIDESEMMGKILQSIATYAGRNAERTAPEKKDEPKIEKTTAKAPERKTKAKEDLDFDEPITKTDTDVFLSTDGLEYGQRDFSTYQLPPASILKKHEIVTDPAAVKSDIQKQRAQLMNVLREHNIDASVSGVDRGPRFIRYRILLAESSRARKVELISDDIALALGVESIRVVAPIPGKRTVGIEIPSKFPYTVSMRELIENYEFSNDRSKTKICLGKTVDDLPLYCDAEKMPHLLIGGSVGMGKSMFISSFITSILYKARPDEVKFIMIDPKQVEFTLYQDMPHLLVPVITDPSRAASALRWAVDEMNRRYDKLEKLPAKNLDAYNEKVAEHPELGAPMPKIFIVIDELADLMAAARDPVENLIMILTQKARAAGIHLVISTQRPSPSVITGVIKANIPSRIACKVVSAVYSRTILDRSGAEKLIGKGDMLVDIIGNEAVRVQGAFISDSETSELVSFIKAQAGGTDYCKSAVDYIANAAADLSGGESKAKRERSVSSDDVLHDSVFLGAVGIAINNGSVCTSFLQRKLKIGYGKAARYIDEMERLGLISEKNGTSPRSTIVTMDEWLEKLTHLLND